MRKGRATQRMTVLCQTGPHSCDTRRCSCQRHDGLHRCMRWRWAGVMSINGPEACCPQSSSVGYWYIQSHLAGRHVTLWSRSLDSSHRLSPMRALHMLTCAACVRVTHLQAPASSCRTRSRSDGHVLGDGSWQTCALHTARRCARCVAKSPCSSFVDLPRAHATVQPGSCLTPHDVRSRHSAYLGQRASLLGYLPGRR